MFTPAPSTALTDAELDRLHDALEGGAAAMKLEMLDGYFAALLCGPEFVSPNEALQEVLGEDFVFDGNDQAADIIGLVMRHWNWVAAELERTLVERRVYLPVLLEDDTGVARGNDWAAGFMRGVQARFGSWNELLDSEDEGGCLVPMMALVHEHDPDPELRPAPITDDRREEVIASMVAGATLAYRFYAPHRRAAATPSAPLRRDGPKVGRNDPCPCGSGRKYKHCCAQALN